MKVVALLIILTSFILGGALLAEEGDSAIDLLAQHEVRLPRGTVNRSFEKSPIIVIFDLEGVFPKSGIDRALIEQAARDRLLHGHVSSEVFERDFSRAFVHGKLTSRELLSPKLVIAVEVEKESADSGYVAKYTLAFFEYPKGGSGSSHLLASKVWSRHREVRGISREGIEDSLLQFVQDESTTWVTDFGDKYVRRSASRTEPVSVKDSSRGEGMTVLGYSLKWNDPDNRRNHFFLGVTAGTPALVNLNAGFWGSRAFPFVAGASGMYYGSATRGVQLDTGWAISNEGKLRHVVGAALMAVNETTSSITYNKDEFGRVTQTNIETINDLKFYGGPTYTIDWKSFSSGNRCRVPAAK